MIHSCSGAESDPTFFETDADFIPDETEKSRIELGNRGGGEGGGSTTTRRNAWNLHVTAPILSSANQKSCAHTISSR